jgi:subtilisin family serine protease
MTHSPRTKIKCTSPRGIGRRSRSNSSFVLVVLLFQICFPARGREVPHVSKATPVVKESSFVELPYRLKREDRRLTSENAVLPVPVTPVGVNNEYLVLQIEYRSVAARRARFPDPQHSHVQGATALTIIGRFADVFVKSRSGCELPQFKRDREVLRCEFARTVRVPPIPPSSLAEFHRRGASEPIVRGGFTDSSGRHFNGKDVYLAIADTGLDFRHPDFITYDAAEIPRSRIFLLWDTTLTYEPGRGSRAPFAYPNGASIGTLFTNDQLTSELRALKNGAAPAIPTMDEDGHGTACAGIAAGNGNADQCTGGLNRPDVLGVAPEAKLIAIRLGRSGAELTNTYLLNAIYEWLDRAAGDRPLVVSWSFGGHFTGHDGQSVAERELDERLRAGEARGRAIAVSAGNDRGKSIHAYVMFGQDSEQKIVRWTADRPVGIGIYFNTSSWSDARSVLKINNQKVSDPPLELNRITGQLQATMMLPAGDGEIGLFNNNGHPTEAHIYLTNTSAARFTKGVAAGYVVTSPGNAKSVITVGSYDFNDKFFLGEVTSTLLSPCKDGNGQPVMIKIGSLSCYSSPGPTRDNRIKPDIVAPGEWYTSSHSATSQANWISDTTGMYVAMNGTSAATPYVAGIIALLFEKNPDLTVNEIKQLFWQNSTKKGLQPFADSLPNSNWGNGKLDMPSIKQILDSIRQEPR